MWPSSVGKPNSKTNSIWSVNFKFGTENPHGKLQNPIDFEMAILNSRLRMIIRFSVFLVDVGSKYALLVGHLHALSISRLSIILAFVLVVPLCQNQVSEILQFYRQPCVLCCIFLICPTKFSILIPTYFSC